MSGVLDKWLNYLTANKEAFAALESIFTVLAIIIGGWWTYGIFVKKRERFPKASLTQAVSFWKVPDGNRLIRVSITIRNEGDVLLNIPSGFTWVQQMKPWPEDLLKQELKKQEIGWPLIASRDIDAGYEIEPKEIEIISMDFVVNEEFEQILVYSYLTNEKKENKGWMVTTIVDLEKEEQEQHHTVMSDQHGIPDKRQGAPKERPRPTEQPPRRIQEQGRPKERPSPANPPVKKGAQ